MKRFYLLIGLLFSATIFINAQTYSVDSLKSIFNRIAVSSSFDDRLELSRKAELSLITLLKTKEIDNLLPPIEHLGRLEADNGLMAVYSWNIPTDDGGNRYFCVIQYKVSKSDKVNVVALNDSNDEGLYQRRLAPKNWYGALYYAIVPVKVKGEMQYVVLGWDGYSSVINRKVIDVITVEKRGNITLGEPVFEANNKFIFRKVFEYSAELRMMLLYDINRKQIVFDHLSPIEKRYENFPQYYGPDFTYDGYTFKKKKWYLQSDIDVRNGVE